MSLFRWYAARFSSVALSLVLISSAMPAWGQNEEVSENLSAEEAKQSQIAARFLGVLEKSPRRGTALDRIYGHHVEFGTLDSFLKSLRKRTQDKPDDGTAWMLLGMFEAHRGEDASAVEAFRQAEQFRPDDALASFYLGQAQLLIGQPDEAVKSFAKALTRKPDREDLLAIYEQLGRVHQRSQRSAEALAVWSRLEDLFPNDVRVLELIAATLAAEDQHEPALQRYEKLISLVKDDYRKTTFRIEAALLKIKLNQRDNGLADLEALLSDLNPDGWLYRDVRQRIENVFMRSADQDGLVKYYTGWMATHPDDVDVMSRLTRLLTSSARMSEAAEWLEKAIARAPTRSDLRRNFIAHLVESQKYPDAIAQYKLLAQSSPGDTDVLRDWGKLVLRDKSMPSEQRLAETKRIWNQILAVRPNDALTTAQLADLYRHSEINDEAIALYQKAIELAPEDPQYREYLGEFYHVLKRPDDARAVWMQIAAEPRRTAENLARLAEVLNGFGYVAEGIEAIVEAGKLDPKELSYQLKAADYLQQTGKMDTALETLDAAVGLATTEEEQEAIDLKRIEILQASDKLEGEIEAITAAVAGEKSGDAATWRKLARYERAATHWGQAAEAINRAIELDPKSLPALTEAVTIAESAGEFGRAVELSRMLADIDRRSRGDHLTKVAQIEAQLGHSEAALAAGQELILSAPGNTGHYEFYAQLCFQLGKNVEGIDTLRKAVRINPTEPQLMIALAAALAGQFRTDEAIELYWRAFEKSESIEDQVSLIVKLSELHLQLNQFDRLTDRLKRGQSEEDQKRAMTICLAQAHQTSGDYGSARLELESLLNQDTRDTELLQQLSKLCEMAQDKEAAVNYQRQLVAIAGGNETESRLAQLLAASGATEEATEIFCRLVQNEEDPVRRIKSVDSLVNAGKYESVLGVVEPLLRENRDNWELMYREGVALAELKKVDEAKDRFQRLLALDTKWEALGLVQQERFDKQVAKLRSEALKKNQAALPKPPTPLDSIQSLRQVNMAAGLQNSDQYYGGNQNPQAWGPPDFGTARLAAWAWLLKFAQNEKSQEAFVQPIREQAQAADASRWTLYDWLYVLNLLQDHDAIFELSKRIAKGGNDSEQNYFLSMLPLRGLKDQSGSSSQSSSHNTPPFSDEEIELILTCFENQRKKSRVFSGLSNTQIIYSGNGQIYMMNSSGNYVVIGSGSFGFERIVSELRRAGRAEQSEALITRELEEAKTIPEVIQALDICRTEKRPERIPEMLDRWQAATQLKLAQLKSQTRKNNNRQSEIFGESLQCMLELSDYLATAGDFETLQRVLDLTTAAAISDSLAVRNRPGYKPGQTFNASRRNNSYYVQTVHGGKQQHNQLSYPIPNEYLSSTMINLLRQVYECYKQGDLLTDLDSFLLNKIESVPPEEKLYYTLMLGSVKWWEEEFDEAIAHMNSVSNAVQADLDFRLEIASLYASRKQLSDALEIVDSLHPRDQKLLQQKEIMALDFAERIGDINRARTAAERLFALRLDADTQLALADRMRRLGLHEQGQAILSRMQRRGGGSVNSQVTLMTQYQGLGNTDMSRQIALSILQRTASPTSSARLQRGYSQDQQSRTQALKVLVENGGIDTLIERVEQQLSRSPDSLPLYDQLIEYYTAANLKDKLNAILKQGMEKYPDNLSFANEYAKVLAQSGADSEACDVYLKLMKQNPDFFTIDFYNVQSLFRKAKRLPDLVREIVDSDLKKMQHPYNVINLASELVREESTTESGVELLLKCYEAFPQYRTNLFSNLYEPRLWNNPRIQELAKKSLIPNENEARSNPWFGIDSVNSYSSGGIASGMLHRMVGGLKTSDQIAPLRSAIEEQVKASPGWLGGKAMLAIIDVKRGKTDAGIAALLETIKEVQSIHSIPYETCWMIGQEIDSTPAGKELALKLYEAATRNGDSRNTQFEYSIGNRLVTIYIADGEREKARQLLINATRENQSGHNDQSYLAYQTLNTRFSVCEKLMSLQFPVDAVHVYSEMVNHPEYLELAAGVFGNPAEQAASNKKRARTGLEAAIKQLKSQNPLESARQMMASRRDGKAGSLDLLVMISPLSEESTAAIACPLNEIIQSSEPDSALLKEIETILAERYSQSPDSLSLQILKSLTRVRRGEAAAADDLIAFLDQHPLDPIEAGKRVNARQRAQAQEWIPVWILARQCLQQPDLKAKGNILAEKTLVAAGRMGKLDATAAILLEWGEIAAKQGDKAEAERRWSQLLDLATQRPGGTDKTAPQKGAFSPREDLSIEWVAFQTPEEKSSPGTSAEGARSQEAAAAETSPKHVAPLTLPQFRTAIKIANLSAENGLFELSQRALSEALIGGLPVSESNQVDALSQAAQPTIRTTYSRQGASQSTDAIQEEAGKAVHQVISKWKNSGIDPATVCLVLEPIVFPANRAEDILIYNDPSGVVKMRASSVGRLLVEWEVQAGRTAQLRQFISERSKVPLAIVSGLTLSLHLALIENDDDAARTTLQALDQQLNTLTSDIYADIAADAVIPAMKVKNLKADVAPVLRRISKVHLLKHDEMDSNNVSPLTWPIIQILNQFFSQTRQFDRSRELYDEILASRLKLFERYGGDYGVYRQRNELVEIAKSAAESGFTEQAGNYLGRAIDLSQTVTANYGPMPSASDVFAAVSREMVLNTPQERYVFWKNWVLPQEGRRSFRFANDFKSLPSVPQEFLQLRDPLEIKKDEGFQRSEFFSSFLLLIDAAEAAGKLDELQTLTATQIEANVPHAALLSELIQLRAGDFDKVRPLVQARFDKARSKPGGNVQRQRDEAGEEYLLWKEMLHHPECADLCQLAYARRKSSLLTDSSPDGTAASSRVAAEWIQFLKQSHDIAAAVTSTGVKDWSGDEDHAAASWIVTDGALVARPMKSRRQLYFNAPLTGDFELQLDTCRSSGSSLSATMFGGIGLQSQSNSLGVLSSVSGHESIYITTDAQLRRAPLYNRVGIAVRDGKLSLSWNGVVYHEETVSETFPWLNLNFDSHVTLVRNLSLTGHPRVLREVPMISKNQMDGWDSSFFSESQPSRRLMSMTGILEQYNSQSRQSLPTEFEWSVASGILTGVAQPGAEHPGWLSYCRPLQHADRVTYRFRYSRDSDAVYPTIGNVAFLLEPDGVKLRWITSSREAGFLRLPADNALVPPGEQKGVAPPQLIENDWNHASLTVKDDVAIVEVNGQVVCEYPIPVETHRRFGFYRPEDFKAVVTDVKLTGEWMSDEALAAALAGFTPESDASPIALRLEEEAWGEIPVAMVRDQVSHARRLPDEQAYDYLRSIVLGADHNVPTKIDLDRAPVTPLAASHSGKAAPSLFQDSEVISPARELTLIAARLGRLDELDQLAQEAPTWTIKDRMNQAAMRVLIAIAKEDDAAAQAQIQEMTDLIASPELKPTGPLEHAAEILTYWYGFERPELRTSLATMYATPSGSRRNGETEAWVIRRREIESRRRLLKTATQDQTQVANAQATSQWRTIHLRDSGSRARGDGEDFWELHPGSVVHHAGAASGLLIFQSPLQGDFEIEAVRSSVSGRGTHLMYGMQALEGSPKTKEMKEVYFTSAGTPFKVKSEIPESADTGDQWKISIKNQSASYHLNGVEVHRAVLAAPSVPWLFLKPDTAYGDGVVRDLRITGNPVIPESLDLLSEGAAGLWTAGNYQDTFTFPVVDRQNRGLTDPAWLLVGGEFTGARLPDVSTRGSETLLSHQRPMLEDGEVELEFFYEAGTTEVHPVVGSTAFMLHGDKLMYHLLSEGIHERNGVSSDAETPVPDAEPLALRANDWNTAVVSLRGDRVTITVNGQRAGSLEIPESPAERFFGLFRFKNQTASKVRKIIWRGDWPKQLPSVESQYLAAPARVAGQ